MNKKLNSSEAGVSMKSKKSYLNDNNSLDFSNSKIQFMSCNVDKDIIDIYLLYNSKKVKSADSSTPNYYRIITKDIGVKDDFQELTFTIINDIQLTINIKFKNKFSSGSSINIKERLRFFNQKPNLDSRKSEIIKIPKKLAISNYPLKEEENKEKKEKPQNVEQKAEIEQKTENIPEEEQENTKTEPQNEKEEEIKKEDDTHNEEEVNNENPKIDEQKEEIVKEEKQIKEEKTNTEKNNYYKNNYNEESSIGPPKATPKKLKMPEAFTSKNKEAPKNQIKEKKNQKKEKEITKSEEQNQIETPVTKEEKINDEKETINEKEEPKSSVDQINIDFKKSKTSKESEINKILKEEKTLPTIEEKEVLPICETLGRSTLQLPISLDEMFLESTTYGQFLKTQKDKGIKHPYRETFCEGFFIASFPQKDGKVIEMSESFPSPCRHKECSELPAMKPEIIFRYPLKDTKTLELNNLAATICFPTGIKVCYNENNGPINIKDYVTSITNQKGERYYMMTYHFYLKLEIDEYQQYEQHPLKSVLQKFGDAYTSLSEEELTEEKINKIQETLEFCQDLGARDFVFIPFCICLISKYPYVKEMKKCLKSIYTILNQKQENSEIIINDLIMYLIHSIPIPGKNTKIKFLLPYNKNCIEIDCPKVDDLNIMNNSVLTLLNIFSIDNLILIFRLLITEKKILIIDEDYENLSNVADGFVSIIYPFQWIHTYIPIMSDQMLKYLETFLPFLNGINKSLMGLVEKAFKNGEIEEDDEVFLIYVSDEKDKIRLSSSLRGKKKKLDKYINDNIPPLPSSLEKELRNKLKKYKNEIEVLKNKKKVSNTERRDLELKIRDAFIEFFVEIFHDYAQYLSILDDDTIFNKSLFIEKRNSDKKFYNEILDTQLFQQFTQNVINSDIDYFNNKISVREENKKVKQTKNKEQIKTYYINPDFLNIENTSDDMKDLLQISNKKYPQPQDQNNVRILEKSIKIEDNKYYEDQCVIYITPEEKEAKNKQVVKEEEKSKKTVNTHNTRFILERIKKLNLKASNSVSKKDGMTEKEKDNLKENIKDNVVQIFKSDVVNLEQKELLELTNKICSPVGRDFFISLLSKNTSNIILLKENSFHLLWNLINQCIVSTLKLAETKSVLENIVQLIKSTRYFGITENNNTTETMFEKYKSTKIISIPKIKQENFWQTWFDIDLKKITNPNDEDKQEIIYSICKTLIELELPKSMIKKITDNINIKLFGKGTEKYKQTFDVFIKFIVNAKYVSQAI